MDTSRRTRLIGHVFSLLLAVALVASAVLKIARPVQSLVDVLTVKLGFPDGTVLGIGLLELTCGILYAIPRTAVLGTVLLTGYFGAAAALHLRVGDSIVTPLVFGGLCWLGTYLRESRTRDLLPLIKGPAASADLPRTS